MRTFLIGLNHIRLWTHWIKGVTLDQCMDVFWNWQGAAERCPYCTQFKFPPQTCLMATAYYLDGKLHRNGFAYDKNLWIHGRIAGHRIQPLKMDAYRPKKEATKGPQ